MLLSNRQQISRVYFKYLKNKVNLKSPALKLYRTMPKNAVAKVKQMLLAYVSYEGEVGVQFPTIDNSNSDLHINMKQIAPGNYYTGSKMFELFVCKFVY